jgi:predicted  nucleic acid-binding Zn-ribbon protein
MAKRLSEQLADLSVRAKSAEQALDAAEKEAHDKVVTRKEQAHAAATKAVEKVNQEVKSANDTAVRNWSTIKAKIADDMNHLKTNIAHAKHEHDVKRAENRADRLEWEAGFAVDYAIASVEQARLAVLDAVDGRLAAEEAKQA